MTEKFTITKNDPYFGCVTLTNPEDKGKEFPITTVSYYCPECARLKAALAEEKRKHTVDTIEYTRVSDHLRNQLAKAKNELVQVEAMHRTQAQTILEKMRIITDFNQEHANYESLIETLREYINDLKARNLAPEPHKLKASILVMQKQLDELTTALAKEQTAHNQDNGIWASRYERDLGQKLSEIAILKRENINIKNHYCCECDSKLVTQNKEVQRLQEEKRIMRQKTEEQSKTIGAKQEEINNLKIELAKAREKQTFEIKPAEEIIRAYEDKLRRLLNIVSSKDEIISGLQSRIKDM